MLIFPEYLINYNLLTLPLRNLMKQFAHFLLACLLLLSPSPSRALIYVSPVPQMTVTVTAGTSSNFLGRSIKNAGNVDSDGYEDVIVGADGISTAYVIYGGPTSLAAVSIQVPTGLNPATTGFKITGDIADRLGYSVSGAGDINNNGYDEIVI